MLSIITPTPDAVPDNNLLRNVLAALATFLMAAGAWMLRKMNKTPNVPSGSRIDAELRRDLNEKLRRELQPYRDTIDQLSDALTASADKFDKAARLHNSEIGFLRSDLQEIRGEMNQLSLRVGRQGGVLRGLEDRFNEE
jgi:hypothetical protein